MRALTRVIALCQFPISSYASSDAHPFDEQVHIEVKIDRVSLCELFWHNCFRPFRSYIAASMAQAHAQQKRGHRRLIGALIVFALLAVGASAAAIFGF